MGRGSRASRTDAARDTDLYREPAIYDILHTPGTAREVDVLMRLARRFGRARRDLGTWAEPACGTGRHLRVLARRGISCWGCDTSEPMVAYARAALARRGDATRVRVEVADMTHFAPLLARSSVDVVFNTINTIRHLESDNALLRHMEQVRSVLAPFGIYVVGIDLTAYGDEEPEIHLWDARRGSCRVRQSITYEPPGSRREPLRFESVSSEIRVDTPSSTTSLRTHYRLRAYDLDQWRCVIDAARWDVLAVTDGSGRDAPAVPTTYRLWVLAPRASSRPSAARRR